MEHVFQLNEKGYTFCIIEHNMDVVMELCTRIVVLNYGEKMAEGSPQEIKNNDDVLEAYFGT